MAQKEHFDFSGHSNIILVDDETDFLDQLSEALRSDGLNVSAFTSGVEALASRNCNDVDVVVADIVLPGDVDGWEVIEQLKSKRPTIESLAITAFYEPEYKVKASELGVFACIEKPISVSLLSNLISGCLTNQRLKKELLQVQGMPKENEIQRFEQEMLQSAFDVLPFPVLIVHEDGKLMFSNTTGNGFIMKQNTVNGSHNDFEVPEKIFESVQEALGMPEETNAQESLVHPSIVNHCDGYKIRTWAMRSNSFGDVAVVFIEDAAFSSESFFDSESAKVWIPIIMNLKS